METATLKDLAGNNPDVKEFYEVYIGTTGVRGRDRKPKTHIIRMGNVTLETKDSEAGKANMTAAALLVLGRQMKTYTRARLVFTYACTKESMPGMVMSHPFDDRNFQIELGGN
jgi:hypothetical protein